jgi:Arc/MetJ-type ribon-helix-helix transcriptional regulator
MIKTTYSLDLDTIHGLDRLARRWSVSRSEALRRAIRLVLEREGREDRSALDALDQAQAALGLTRAAAARWENEIRAERRAATPPRRGRRS